MSQKPPKQTPEQHTDAAVHAPPIGTQLVVRIAHAPPVHVPPQQSAPVVHAPPVATHGVLHVCVVGSHTPWQQSASAVQAAFCAWHVPGGNPQRGGSTD